MKINKLLIKEFGWIFFGQVISVFINLVIIRLLTENLTAYQYGELSIWLSIGLLICQIGFSGVVHGICRYYNSVDSLKDLSDYAPAAKKLMLFAGCITLIIGLPAIIGLNMSGYRSSLWLGVFCLMYGLFFNYSTVINSILNGSRLRMEATIFLTLDVFLRLSILLIIFKLFDKSNISAITSYVVSIVVVLILQIISIKKYIFINSYDMEAIRKWTHKILRLSSPYIVLGPIVLIQSSSDRWAIGFFNNIESVGLYTVVYQLAYSPMVMIMNLVVKLIEPILYKTIESNNTTEYNKLTELTKKCWGIVLFAHQLYFLLLIVFMVSFLAYLLHLHIGHIQNSYLG